MVMKNEKGITLVELISSGCNCRDYYCSITNHYDWYFYKNSKPRKRNTNYLCCSGSYGENTVTKYLQSQLINYDSKLLS